MGGRLKEETSNSCLSFVPPREPAASYRHAGEQSRRGLRGHDAGREAEAASAHARARQASAPAAAKASVSAPLWRPEGLWPFPPSAR
ncbi:hypothetical protein [Agrobacterium tumefaciens]|uniref:hypothetical protein n=1 Tax=Agrobacterium tumefaciens TaxID=358 RepID=UPI003C6C23E5